MRLFLNGESLIFSNQRLVIAPKRRSVDAVVDAVAALLQMQLIAVCKGQAMATGSA